MEDQLNDIEFNQLRNDVKLETIDRQLQALAKQRLPSSNSRVRVKLTSQKLINANQDRMIRSYASISSKLTDLNSTGTTLAEFAILPTFVAATSVSTKNVSTAKKLMSKIEDNTSNQESLEEVMLSACDIEDNADEWQASVEQAQVDELEQQMMDKQKQRVSNLKISK